MLQLWSIKSIIQMWVSLHGWMQGGLDASAPSAFPHCNDGLVLSFPAFAASLC